MLNGMTMITTHTEPVERRGSAVPRLGRGTRRAALTVHVVAAGVWLGIDAVLGVLVLTARLTDSTDTEALCYRALELFAVWPLFTAGAVTLASGIVLGLGTKYGLVKYWWVAAKLVLNVVLTALILIALRPAVHEASTYGEALAAGQATDASVRELIFPPIVSSIALVAATILAVYKPWGRIRGDRSRAVRAAGER
jgi:hypothetical protein